MIPFRVPSWALANVVRYLTGSEKCDKVRDSCCPRSTHGELATSQNQGKEKQMGGLRCSPTIWDLGWQLESSRSWSILLFPSHLKDRESLVVVATQGCEPTRLHGAFPTSAHNHTHGSTVQTEPWNPGESSQMLIFHWERQSFILYVAFRRKAKIYSLLPSIDAPKLAFSRTKPKHSSEDPRNKSGIFFPP